MKKLYKEIETTEKGDLFVDENVDGWNDITMKDQMLEITAAVQECVVIPDEFYGDINDVYFGIFKDQYEDYIGDVKNTPTLEAFKQTIEKGYVRLL